MQFQADILGVAVQRPKDCGDDCSGAAYLAGLAVGFWKSQTNSPDSGPSIAPLNHE